MPITAFIGVRISWLIVARNALFASLAASAAARASCASLNRRAFWIAMTAWSAKLCSSACSLSLNGRGGWRTRWIVPMPRSSHSIGAISIEKLPTFSVIARMPAGTPGPFARSG